MISLQAENVKKAMLENKNLEYLLKTPLEVKRKNWEEAAAADTLPEGMIIKRTVIRGTPAEWITMDNVSKDNIIMYFHGGGYSQGSIITHRKLTAHIVKSTGLPILILDYPLAPENPYPAALNRAKEVYSYLLNNGFKAQNIVLGGDSAGGGLAAALALFLKEKGIPLPKGIFMLSPWLDLTLSGESIKTCAEKDPLCFKEDLEMDADYYRGAEPLDSPFISPIYSDITGFPSVLIQAGSDDMLLSDSTRFADKAKASQVNVQLSIWDGMWHVFQAWVGGVPEATDAIDEIGWFTKTILYPISSSQSSPPSLSSFTA